MTEPKSNFIGPIALILFLIVLPLGSYFYLSKGKDFYKANLAMMEPKSTIDPFLFLNPAGDSIGTSEFEGKVWIASFMKAPCEANCEQKIEQLKILQKAFEKTGTASILNTIFASNDSTLASNQLLIEGINASFWKTIALPDSAFQAWTSTMFQDAPNGIDTDMFILVDDSLRIRKYYPGTISDSVELMVRHLAMILPKEERSEIGFEREKEK